MTSRFPTVMTAVLATLTLSACSSSSGGGRAALPGAPSSKNKVPLSAVEAIVNGSRSAAATREHRKLCDELLGTPAYLGKVYFDGKGQLRMLGWTTDSIGMECAYTLTATTGSGDEGVAKDFDVSVGATDPASAISVQSPAAVATSDSAFVVVDPGQAGKLSAKALADEVLFRISG